MHLKIVTHIFLILLFVNLGARDVYASSCSGKINKLLDTLEIPNPIDDDVKFDKYFTGHVDKIDDKVPLFEFHTKSKFPLIKKRLGGASGTKISELTKLKIETVLKKKNLYLYFYEGSMRDKTGIKHIFILTKKCRLKSYTVKRYLPNKIDYVKITSNRSCRLKAAYTPNKQIDNVMGYFNKFYHEQLCKTMR